MCIAILRDPGITIPEDKIANSILNNPDGYGLSFPVGNGRLQTMRSAESPDPEGFYNLLHDDLKEEQLLVHLRYTTAGKTILRNSHPFPILERDKDGLDIRMAHNGTIHSFKPGKDNPMSDTRLFVRDYVRPLFKRMAKVLEPEELLTDALIQRILKEAIPPSSVLCFLDGNGGSMVINETGNGGGREEGWYFSNKYSFDPKHRVPSTGFTQGTYQKTGGYPKTTTTTTSQIGTATQCFTEKYGIEEEDLLLLNDAVIAKLTNVYSSDAALLIKELLCIFYTLKERNCKLHNQVQALKEKLKA